MSASHLGDREKYRQRRRSPRPLRDPDDPAISKVVDEAYDLIPEIGGGYRCYDWPYRLLSWLGSGWRQRLFPERVRGWIWSGVNYLLPFAEHDRDKVWPLDELHHNVFVPQDEHVKVAGIWAIGYSRPLNFMPSNVHFARTGGSVGSDGHLTRTTIRPHLNAHDPVTELHGGESLISSGKIQDGSCRAVCQRIYLRSSRSFVFGQYRLVLA